MFCMYGSAEPKKGNSSSLGVQSNEERQVLGVKSMRASHLAVRLDYHISVPHQRDPYPCRLPHPKACAKEQRW